MTREFYKLPLEEKQKYSNLVDGQEFRMEGYGNDIVVSEKQTLDWSDRLYLVVEPESRRIYSMWPAHPPSFRYTLRFFLVSRRFPAWRQAAFPWRVRRALLGRLPLGSRIPRRGSPAPGDPLISRAQGSVAA